MKRRSRSTMESGDKVLVHYKKNDKWFESVLKSKSKNGTWSVIWLTTGKWYGTITDGVREEDIIVCCDKFTKKLSDLEKKFEELQKEVIKTQDIINQNFTLKILPFMAASRVQTSETRNLLDTIHQNQLLTTVTSDPEIPSIELSSVELGDVVIEDP